MSKIKTLLFILFATTLFISVVFNTTDMVNKLSNSEKIEVINWYKYEDIENNKNSNKYIMIDFYTNWCGYCKKLDKLTYSDNAVIKLINKKFIPIRINAESKEKVFYKGVLITKLELAKNFNVQSYPYVVFMKNDKVIGSIRGFRYANYFYNYLTYISNIA